MKKKTVKFTAVFLCVCVAIAGVLSAAAFLFDPQNVYRWNEKGVRYFNPTYSTAGAVENFDYDLAIIGSSMVQNYSADKIAKTLACKPVKLTIGAMTPNELLFLYDRAQKKGSAKRYIINLDLHRIAAAESVEPDSGRFPLQMFSPGGISQFRYLLGFETWFRFMPIDFALTASKSFNITLSPSFSSTVMDSTDINRMCEWDLGALPGAENIIEQYNHGETGFNEGDNTVYSDTAVENVDRIFEYLTRELNADESITIVLSPYSVLYWASKNESQLNTLFQLRKRIAQLADGQTNIRVLDFQSIKDTENLDNYYDMSHFSPEILAVVEAGLATTDYEVNTAQVEKNSEIILSYSLNFKEQF